MSDDTTGGDSGPNDEPATDDTDVSSSTNDVQDNVQEGLKEGRKRLEESGQKAVESFDTDTRARIYVFLRQNPQSTSEEIAEGTGLYPSTVREALAELTNEEKVMRQKRESEGAGNNPYEYEAIAPSDLVGGVIGDVQNELNTVFNLDNYLGGRGDDVEADSEPISITVTEESDVNDDEDSGVLEGDEEDSGVFEGDEEFDNASAGEAETNNEE